VITDGFEDLIEDDFLLATHSAEIAKKDDGDKGRRKEISGQSERL
jgi:hypothetical protein